MVLVSCYLCSIRYKPSETWLKLMHVYGDAVHRREGLVGGKGRNLVCYVIEMKVCTLALSPTRREEPFQNILTAPPFKYLYWEHCKAGVSMERGPCCATKQPVPVLSAMRHIYCLIGFDILRKRRNLQCTVTSTLHGCNPLGKFI